MNNKKLKGKQDSVFILERAGFSKADAGKMYDILIDNISESLLQGHPVSLPKIGTLTPNFKKSKTMKVAGRLKAIDKSISVSFKTSKGMLEAYRSTLDPNRPIANIKAARNIFK